MDNTNNINNDETKPEKVNSKDNEEYKIKQGANSKRVYERDEKRIIARIRTNQKSNQELKQLERLSELKEQG